MLGGGGGTEEEEFSQTEAGGQGRAEMQPLNEGDESAVTRSLASPNLFYAIPVRYFTGIASVDRFPKKLIVGGFRTKNQFEVRSDPSSWGSRIHCVFAHRFRSASSEQIHPQTKRASWTGRLGWGPGKFFEVRDEVCEIPMVVNGQSEGALLS
jgi:hypothetical protein